jgi:Flp pilus assembly protein TadD
LWDLGNKPAALAIWKQAAEHFPTESSLVPSAARAQYDLGDYKGAEENYRRAIALDPANREIRTDLAWTLLATSNFREAQQICREVLAQDSANAAAKAILARMPKGLN